MEVKYVVLNSSFKEGSAAGSKFIRVVRNETVTNETMARIISDQCSVTEADILAVLQAYETNLKLQFSIGNSVQMFNLGTLKPCFKAKFDMNGNVVKNSVRMSKIQLIANSSFLEQSKSYRFKNMGEIKELGGTFEKRVEGLLRYFEKGNTDITSSCYSDINDCSRITANRDLKLLYDNEILSRKYFAQVPVYNLANQDILTSLRQMQDNGSFAAEDNAIRQIAKKSRRGELKTSSSQNIPSVIINEIPEYLAQE